MIVNVQSGCEKLVGVGPFSGSELEVSGCPEASTRRGGDVVTRRSGDLNYSSSTWRLWPPPPCKSRPKSGIAGRYSAPPIEIAQAERPAAVSGVGGKAPGWPVRRIHQCEVCVAARRGQRVRDVLLQCTAAAPRLGVDLR